MKIPFSPPYIDEDVIAEVTDSLQSGWITTGPKVLQLENEVAAYCNAEKALAVNSATSAMMLVLHWFGVTRGDEVIVPAYTYCATALAVMHVGATPVMVDIDNDFNIDAAKIKAAITGKTKAVIAVDIGGWPCNYNAITKVIQDEKHKFAPRTNTQKQLGRLLLMADAAHSFGAVYNNKVTGTLADITVFSFHAVKNVTTAEGGIICLHMPVPFDNKELYKTLRLWSLNGQTKDAFTKSRAGGWKYDIVYPGFKMNMPDVLAAIGLAQIRKYGTMLLRERKRVFDVYTAAFSRHSWAIIPPFEKAGCTSSYHLYALRVSNITEQQRDEIIEYITAKGVAVNVHFIPMPLLTVFKNAGYNIADYPETYLMYSGEISLPVYPQLTDGQCKFV
ncbi:MAG TPA: DegT/DnrJ/EryC1/StrS family aminotransferase, partial [Chitinophagaceae bacterium]|nr:DegT/DnrJ/EryC1/StrS family aminotransferase [Chitinophagaceae bacterium]